MRLPVLPYPMRGLRTRDFAYIRNFAPDRWPMGDPGTALTPEAVQGGALETDRRVGFADMDPSPTKAWLIRHRNDPEWRWHYNLAFGRRPAEELFDLRTDPDQIRNLAADPAYATIKARLERQLMDTLTAAHDPRVIGDGKTFDRPPFTDLPPPPLPKAGARKKTK